MTRSEGTRPASDVMIREVTRQLADTAPPAPTWRSIQNAGRPVRSERRRQGPRLVLVAAVTALVVSGIWWLRGPNRQSPADVPIPPPPTTQPVTVVEDPGIAWRNWVEETEPLAVQLCIARSRSNLTASADLTAEYDEAGIPGYSSDIQELVWHRPLQAVMVAIGEHPDIDSELELGLRTVTDAFAAADAGQFDEDGSLSDQLPLLVDGFLTIRATSEPMASDPGSCWLDGVDDPLFTPAEATDPAAMLQCLGVAQLDHALWAATQGEEAWNPLVDAAAFALVLQFTPPLPELTDLASEISDAILFETFDEDAAATARADLATLDLETSTNCRLSPLTGDGPTHTTNPDNRTE